MKMQTAYYDGLDLDQLLERMENKQLANSISNGESFKKKWKLVKKESDIQELIYFFLRKREKFTGCIGAMDAQDALDFIHRERDKKIHELGECYR